MRKLEREVGPLRFVPDSDDDRLVNVTVEWKRAQYQRIRSVDHLEQPWTRERDGDETGRSWADQSGI